MGLSAFTSENPAMATSLVDGMSMNAVQFRQGGGAQQVFNSNDRQDRFWSSMGLDQSNGVGREALGLGLGMGMRMGMGSMGMGLGGMGMGMGMGMVQQPDHQGVHYGLRSGVNESDKRELLGWSMLGGSVGVEGSAGGVVGGSMGVESLGMRNDQSFFTTSLAPPLQPTVVSSEIEEKIVKNENAQADGTEMASRSDQVGRWDFEHGDMQQSTCTQNTEQYAHHHQQSTDQNTESCGQHVDAEDQEKFGGRGMSVEDSEGQSIDERWTAWEEEKQAKEASSKQEQHVYFHRECQRNLAADKGCTVLDGCGEFMPADEEGKPNALLCAACNCHRNFHRRVLCDKDGFEIDNKSQEETLRATHDCIASIKNVANEVTLSVNQAISVIQQEFKTGTQGEQFTPSQQFEQTFNPASFLKCLDGVRKAAKAMLLTADCLTTLQSANLHSKGSAAPNVVKDGVNSDCSSSLLNQFRNGKQLLPGVHNGAQPLQLSESAFNERKEKRKRTRFSTEQITKLNDFAMEVGWTLAGLAKEDIDAVCENVGIEPTTLKYWLYNTRQKSKRRHQEDEMSQSVS